jgi:hypothetical protein
MTVLKSKAFLHDFELWNRQNIESIIKKDPWFYSHIKMSDGEMGAHYGVKFDMITLLNQKFGNRNDFYIFNELEQKHNPFVSELDKSTEYHKYYTLDICVIFFIKPRNPLIVDIEIDGENHYRKKQMQKDRVRDALLKERYDVDTQRIDVSDPSYSRVLNELCSRID